MSCAKRRYRDPIAAKLALATIRQRDNSNRPKTETRWYRCNLCGGIHLTSKPRSGRNDA